MSVVVSDCIFSVTLMWIFRNADLRTPDTLLIQASFQGPPVSAVVYAAAGRWAQHRSSGAIVTV